MCRENGIQKKTRRILYADIIGKFNKVAGSEQDRVAAIQTGEFVNDWASDLQKLLAALFVDAVAQRFKLVQDGHRVPFTVVSDMFCR